MNCRQAKRKMERLVFGGLRDADSARICEHLRSCPTCSEERAKYETLRAGLERVRKPLVLSGSEIFTPPQQLPSTPGFQRPLVAVGALVCGLAIATLFIYVRQTAPPASPGAPRHTAPAQVERAPKAAAEQDASPPGLAAARPATQNSGHVLAQHHARPQSQELKARPKPPPAVTTATAPPPSQNSVEAAAATAECLHPGEIPPAGGLKKMAFVDTGGDITPPQTTRDRRGEQ